MWADKFNFARITERLIKADYQIQYQLSEFNLSFTMLATRLSFTDIFDGKCIHKAKCRSVDIYCNASSTGLREFHNEQQKEKGRRFVFA